MIHRRFQLSVGFFTLLFSLYLAVATAADRPNIVLIVADDLGWNDVSYHGGPIQTPNMDRLADEGLELNRFYVCPVCTPTRAGIMTGRYPIRFGLQRAVIPPWRDFGMDTSEQTLPELLETAGYKHRAIIGKWHLGHTERAFHPLMRGFTEFYGHYNGAVDYFTHEREGELDWHRGFESNYDEGYSTDLMAAEAVKFIEQYAKDGSFFLYVPFNAPHSPLQAKEEDLQNYAHLKGNVRENSVGKNGYGLNDRQTLAAMVSSLDQGIGRILSTLDNKGLSDNTIVWFTSDNGGTMKLGADNTPLREGKATVWEGGIRVVASLRWPNGLPGKRVIETPMQYVDILPTLLHMAGVTEQPEKALDGQNMTALLRGDSPDPERELFNYIGQQGEENEQLSLITPEWKLVRIGPNMNRDQADFPGVPLTVELFKINEDPYERHNVAAQYPDVVKTLMHRLKEFKSLEPENGVPPYAQRNGKFVAPKEWRIPE